MKKKILGVLCLGGMMLSLTGCVKFNANMNIKKDKSMDFSIIFAVDPSLLEGQDDVLSDEDRKKAEEEGFSITDYDDGKMKGYTLSKKIKNIDSVSSTSDSEYNLSGMFEGTDQKYMFKVKKGFLKNTYYAKFKFDATNRGLGDMTNSSDNDFDSNDNDEDIEGLADWNFSDDDFEKSDESNDNSEMDFSQLQGLTSNMDLSFNVTLPYSAKKNNASTKNDDNKNLTWNLMTIGNSASTVEFEFELYNKSAVFIGAGIIVGLIIIIVAVVVFILKNKNNKDGGKKSIVENHVEHHSVTQQPSVQPMINQTPVQHSNVQSIHNQTPVQQSSVQPMHNQTPVQHSNVQSMHNQTPVQQSSVQPMHNQTPEQQSSVQPMHNQTPEQQSSVQPMNNQIPEQQSNNH